MNLDVVRICSTTAGEPSAATILRLAWLRDSLKPDGKPLIERFFRINPDIEGFEDAMKKDGFRQVGDQASHQVWVHDERQICTERNQNPPWMRIRGTSIDRVTELYSPLKTKYEQETQLTNTLKLLVESDNTYSLTNLSNPGQELETLNYAPAVIRSFEYLAKQLVSDKPKGRIGVLSGYPGTGKTYLLRAILNRYVENTDFVLLNTEQCINLGKNLHKFMQMLASYSGNVKRKLVLIMEDADSAIAPRKAQNLSAIQSILNFGDGLMGEALDIRILVTTNIRTVEIDPAILRPGRLIVHLDVTSLDAQQANAVYHRLSGQNGPYKTPTTIAQVYQDAVPPEEQESVAAE